MNADLQQKLACLSAELHREREKGIRQFVEICGVIARAHAECVDAKSESSFRDWVEDEGYSRWQAYRMLGVAEIAGSVSTLRHLDQSGLMLLAANRDSDGYATVLKEAQKRPLPHKEVKQLLSGTTPTEPAPPRQDAGTDADCTDAGGGDELQSHIESEGTAAGVGVSTDPEPAGGAGGSGPVSPQEIEAVIDHMSGPVADPSTQPGQPQPSHPTGGAALSDRATLAEIAADLEVAQVLGDLGDAWTDDERRVAAILIEEWGW